MQGYCTVPTAWAIFMHQTFNMGTLYLVCYFICHYVKERMCVCILYLGFSGNLELHCYQHPIGQCSFEFEGVKNSNVRSSEVFRGGVRECRLNTYRSLRNQLMVSIRIIKLLLDLGQN
jgi:hypothetical protein